MLPSATSVLFSSSVRMTAVPEAAFLGWTEIREETDAMEDTPAPFPGLEHPVAPRAEVPGTLLDPARQLLFLLQEDEDDGDEDDVLETGDDDGEEGLEETDFGDNDEEDVEEVGEHEVEMTIEFDPCS